MSSAPDISTLPPATSQTRYSATDSPYPGLRPFAADEAKNFFGRDRCVDGMARTLEDTRFLAVLGPSGSGKSSLVRSGLFNHLQAGMARKAGPRWRFLDLQHPGTTPYAELAKAILRDENGELTADDAATIAARRRTLFMNPAALIEWWDGQQHHPDENILLLVDQFEELFKFETAQQRDEVESFVDLLLHTAAQHKMRFYVVMTMRSEFLGGCSLFPGLAEQINQSLSLTPRMTREECREAIVGPVYGHNLELDPLLVTTLLNDMNSLAQFDPDTAGTAGGDTPSEREVEVDQADLIARRADQLPLMQHVLNWMWTSAATTLARGELVELTLDAYLALGGLREALSRHASRVSAATGNEELVSRIFRALTDQPVVATAGAAEITAVRRPRTVGELAVETESDTEAVCAVIDHFRIDGISMLTPDTRTDLTDDQRIDISHESLIRQWGDLRGWIRDEAEGGRNWQQLLLDLDKGKRLRGLDLAERTLWWNRFRPRDKWADRYGGQWAPVDQLLRASQRSEARRKTILRLWAAGSVAALVGAGGLLVYALDQRDAILASTDEARGQQARAEMAARDAAEVAASSKRQLAAMEASIRIKEAKVRETEARARQQMVKIQQEVAFQNRERVRIAREMGGEIANYYHELVATAPLDQPDRATALFSRVEQGIAMLRTTSPADYNATTADLLRARGQLAANQVDPAEMGAVASRMDALASSFDGSTDLPDLLRSDAARLRGEADRFNGNDEAAAAAFLAASTFLPAPRSIEQHVAKATAQGLLAATLLDLGHAPAALDASRKCVTGLPKNGAEKKEESSDVVEAQSLAQARCQTILAAATDNYDEAMERFKQGAEIFGTVKAATVPANAARADFLVRYFRRWKPETTKGFQALTSILEPLGTSLLDDLDEKFAEDAKKNADYPSLLSKSQFALLDDFSRSRAINVFTKALVRDSESMGKMSEYGGDSFPIFSINDGVIADAYNKFAPIDETAQLFSASGSAKSKILLSIVFDNIDNKLFALKELIAHNSTNLYDIVPSVEKDIKMISTLADKGDTLSRKRLFDDALQFATLPKQIMQLSRYNEFQATLTGIVTWLCTDSIEPDSGACADLHNAEIASADYQARQLVAPLTADADSQRKSAARVWNDKDRFALSGFDPVNCFLRTTSSSSVGGHVSTCTLQRGRLQYATTWEGQVWLFDSAVNQNKFNADKRYIPRFGGYDIIGNMTGNLSDLMPDTSFSQTISGAIFADDLYITNSFYLLNEKTAKEAQTRWTELLAANQGNVQAPVEESVTSP